jgi:hypothetical protein
MNNIILIIYIFLIIYQDIKIKINIIIFYTCYHFLKFKDIGFIFHIIILRLNKPIDCTFLIKMVNIETILTYLCL